MLLRVVLPGRNRKDILHGCDHSHEQHCHWLLLVTVRSSSSSGRHCHRRRPLQIMFPNQIHRRLTIGIFQRQHAWPASCVTCVRIQQRIRRYQSHSIIARQMHRRFLGTRVGDADQTGWSDTDQFQYDVLVVGTRTTTTAIFNGVMQRRTMMFVENIQQIDRGAGQQFRPLTFFGVGVEGAATEFALEFLVSLLLLLLAVGRWTCCWKEGNGTGCGGNVIVKEGVRICQNGRCGG
mmetsp:Transcript_43011/g.66095  ORF Transcript_43011/g.66095 Transcript_43011/m.66095 type:complete len:235 (-) Transcript_43011:93-797(-)